MGGKRGARPTERAVSSIGSFKGSGERATSIQHRGFPGISNQDAQESVGAEVRA